MDSARRAATSFQYICRDCGKGYKLPGYLATHQRGCQATKRSFSAVVENHRLQWDAKKKRRLVEAQLTADPPPVPAPISVAPPDMSLPLAIRKGARERQLPPRYIQEEDVLPEPLLPMDEVDPALLRLLAQIPTSRPAPRPFEDKETRPNAFGIVRQYSILKQKRKDGEVMHDPERAMTLQDLSDQPSASLEVSQGSVTASRQRIPPSYGPFASRSSFSLADWYWRSGQKSLADFKLLVDVMKHPDFRLDDVVHVNWDRTFKALGANKEDLGPLDGSWIEDDGWLSKPISIDVPFHNRMQNSGNEAYVVGELRYRSILSVIKEKIANAKDMQQFHFRPYRASWKPFEGSPAYELYGEMYGSQAFRDADEEVQNLHLPTRDPAMERVVVSMMFSSDETHVNTFGTSSIWPLYLFFGNESKERRCQPNGELCNHIAYFQKLPDSFHDYLKHRAGGKLPTKELIAHCAREVFHKQWSILLDPELREAMKEGIALECPDGKTRLFFPRILTYSADYPEKILVGCVRKNGTFPCTRCFVQKRKDKMSNLGSPEDVERRTEPRNETEQQNLVAQAREEIYVKGYAVDSDKVEGLLKPKSLTPIQNAFAELDQPFRILPALVVDLLHEFEIGSWKKVFIHGVRLLEAFTVPRTGISLKAELDFRYRATPAHGRDGIRKFGPNSSEMKRKAARDYVDLLQCAIPAFEGLFPEPHNAIFMKLLFIYAEWHALAKLRLHNDLTLERLEYMTTHLGAQTRIFERDTCKKTPTKELAKEAEARERRGVKDAKDKAGGRRPVSFSVYTIKFHYLGDYVSTIRHFGTTDSYSTEAGELHHRLPKGWYARTDKRDFESQMSKIERRRARLSKLRCQNAPAPLSASGTSNGPSPTPVSISTPPEAKYSVAANQNSSLDLYCTFGSQYPEFVRQDPYALNFIPKLKRHLLPRLIEKLGLGQFDPGAASWESVALQDRRLYQHQLLHVNYTTYDVRRACSVIHVDTPQCNVMLLNDRYTAGSATREHPYLYAKVLGIFHANVFYLGALSDGIKRQAPYRLDIVWVRWYEVEKASTEFAPDHARLCTLDNENSLGFVNPAHILRGVHIIPRFSQGKSEKPEPKSPWARELDGPWKAYHINRFADRDLYMRYQWGLSVGHSYMHKVPNLPSRPTIPPDFDYCLVPPPPPKERSNLPSLNNATETDVPRSVTGPVPYANALATPSLPEPRPGPSTAPRAALHMTEGVRPLEGGTYASIAVSEQDGLEGGRRIQDGLDEADSELDEADDDKGNNELNEDELEELDDEQFVAYAERHDLD